MRSAGLVSEAQVIGQAEPGRGGPLGPLDWRKVLPFEPCAATDSLGGWTWMRLASGQRPRTVSSTAILRWTYPPRRSDR
jgi:hypothetical protein